MQEQERLKALSLFTGIEGIGLGLQEYVTPILYCEKSKFAQQCLLTNMQRGAIPIAPIWEDIKTLRGSMLPEVDIIIGGFPCQDISLSNPSGKGLDGEKSGLFYELARVVSETKPKFIFLENVQGIINKGLLEVSETLTELGYDSEWLILPASSVGAPHLRRRWFMLSVSDTSSN